MESSLHKEPHTEDKGHWAQVVPEVSLWSKKDIFYGKNGLSQELPPKGCGEAFKMWLEQVTDNLI